MDMQHSCPTTQFLYTLLQSAAPGGRSDGLSVAVTVLGYIECSDQHCHYHPRASRTFPHSACTKWFGLRSHFPDYISRFLRGYIRNLNTILPLRGPPCLL